MGKHLTLDDLPPALREQAVAQMAPTIAERVAASVAETPSGGATRIPCRRVMTETERSFFDYFCRVSPGAKILFEPLTLRLAGGSRYTPDFLIAVPGKPPVLVEIKGSFRLPSHGRALTAFREARAQFGDVFSFVWLEKKEGKEWRWLP